MAAHEVGSILGYLQLDRSNWDQELAAAGRKADDLARHNPNIKINTNAPSAIAQLAAVAAATKRLQDAQGAERLALGKLSELQASGNTSASKLAAAEERVQKAHRATAAATIALANAYDANDRAVNRVADDTKKIAKQSDDAHKPVLSLASALAIVGPAAIPIASVGVGAIAGLIPVAGAAALAVLGLKKDFEQGRLEGTAFGKDITSLRGELNKLEQTAAGGVLNGLHKGVADLKPELPLVNKDVAVLSSQLGDIVGHVAPGLVSLFTRVNPLFQTFGDDVDKGSASFQRWAQSSQSVSRFVAYVQQELPVVEQTLGNLAETASHVVMGLAPFGSTSLRGINLLSQAINAIPVNVLQSVEPALVGAFAGSKIAALASNASDSLQGFSDKAEQMGGLAEKIGGPVGKLGKAVGFLGPVGAAASVGLGIASSVMGLLGQKAIEEKARINDLTTALEQGTGAAKLWADAQELGVSAATKYGVSQATLMSALQGSKAAMESAQAQLDSYQQVQDNAAMAAGRFGASSEYVAQRQGEVQGKITDLKASLAQLRDEYQKALKNASDFARKAGDSALAQQVLSGKVGTVARELGTTADNYYAARLAADKNTQQTKAQTLAFQLENDAASLVNQALATMAGQNLNVAQAQTSLAQATSAVIQSMSQDSAAMTAASTSLTNARGRLSVAELHLAAVRKNSKASATELASAEQSVASAKSAVAAAQDRLTKVERGHTVQIQGNTAAALANQQAIQAQVQAARSLMQAIAQQTHSGEKAIQSYRDSKKALEDQLRAQGELTPAVQRYINKLYDVKGISDYLTHHPTQFDVNAGPAIAKLITIKKHIDAIHGKTVVINTIHTVSGGGINVQGGAGVRARASGGPVGGAGAKGVDSQLLLAAPGEWVISDKAVDRITAKYGPGAMAMINRGALPAPMTLAPSVGGSAASSGSTTGEIAAALEKLARALDRESLTVKHFEQKVYNPLPEKASDTSPAGLRRMARALGR